MLALGSASGARDVFSCGFIKNGVGCYSTPSTEK